jgi:hypothetical protein
VAPVAALGTVPQAVQTFAAEAYDPTAQVAVHVSVPQFDAASVVKVFASVPALHKPVAKRLLVAFVQVKVASSAAPATAVHLVHAPAFNQYPVLHDAAFSSVAVVHMYVAALVVVVPQIVQTSLVPVPSLK